MKSPFQRRAAIASLFLLAPVLGACGFSAQTDQVYQAAVGPDARDSDVDVLNAVVVTNGTGQGTFAGSLVNNTDTADRIENVTADAGVTIVPGGALTIPAYGLVNLSNLLENGEIPLLLDGEPVSAGGYVTITFTFANAEPVTIMAPVVDNTGVNQDYEGVPLAPTRGEVPADAAEDEEHSGDETHSEDEGTES